MEFLAETAFLTRGLVCLRDEELEAVWPFDDPVLVWVAQGKIVRGNLQAYLPFRAQAQELPRLDCMKLNDALRDGLSGSLTASGTMAVCEQLGISLAVTCGMGGVGQIKAEQLCADLPALATYPVALLASSPKDMLDIPATIRWLTDQNVHVAGPDCTGWVFNGPSVSVPEDWSQYPTADTIRQAAREDGLLLLNPIAAEARISDRGILQSAIHAGLLAEQNGGDYHPAANAEIHRLTHGYSARLQLQAFVNNLKLAKSL